MIYLFNTIKVNICLFFWLFKEKSCIYYIFLSYFYHFMLFFFIVDQKNEIIYQNNQIDELKKSVEILNNQLITRNQSIETIETNLRELSYNYKAHLENIYSNQGVFDDKLEALNSTRLRPLTVRTQSTGWRISSCIYFSLSLLFGSLS